jgi:hypothetical protein
MPVAIRFDHRHEFTRFPHQAPDFAHIMGNTVEIYFRPQRPPGNDFLNFILYL